MQLARLEEALEAAETEGCGARARERLLTRFLPGHGISQAFAVSDDGRVVVGRSEVDEPGPLPLGQSDAFRWEGGAMIPLSGIATIPQTAAHGVSLDGSAIVGRGADGSGGVTAIRWDSGAASPLEALEDPPMDLATAVSADGSVVVGYSAEGFSPRWAVRWGAGGVFALNTGGTNFVPSEAWGVSADGSVVAGWTSTPDGVRAFRWEGSMTIFSLDAEFSQAQAFDISSDGSVVVGRRDHSAGGSEAFRWENGTTIGLGELDGLGSLTEALGISANGSIVGSSCATAFVWDPVNQMRSVENVLIALGIDLAGWALVSATDISADGNTVVGWGLNPSGDTEAWIAVIPEPSTALLLASGLAALAVRRLAMSR